MTLYLNWLHYFYLTFCKLEATQRVRVVAALRAHPAEKSVGHWGWHLPKTFLFFLKCLWSENAQQYQHLSQSNSHNNRGKFWKIPNHEKDTAKRWCIPQMPSSNLLSGQKREKETSDNTQVFWYSRMCSHLGWTVLAWRPSFTFTCKTSSFSKSHLCIAFFLMLDGWAWKGNYSIMNFYQRIWVVERETCVHLDVLRCRQFRAVSGFHVRRS